MSAVHYILDLLIEAGNNYDELGKFMFCIRQFFTIQFTYPLENLSGVIDQILEDEDLADETINTIDDIKQYVIDKMDEIGEDEYYDHIDDVGAAGAVINVKCY